VKLTSFLKVMIILFLILLVEDETFHKVVGNTSIVNSIVVQEDENIEELGSNTENKFVIILYGFG